MLSLTSFTWKQCLVSHIYATNMPGVNTYTLLEGSWSFIHADKKLQSACVLWFVITYPCFSCTCLLHRNNIIAISCNPSIPPHCGLVTPSGVREIGQHRSGNGLLPDVRHQIFTWTNVDLSSVRSNDIHLRAIWYWLEYYLSKNQVQLSQRPMSRGATSISQSKGTETFIRSGDPCPDCPRK